MFFVKVFILSLLTISEVTLKPQFHDFNAFQEYMNNLVRNSYNEGFNGSNYPQMSAPCSSFWFLQGDFYEKWILISMSEPFHETSELRVKFSLNTMMNLPLEIKLAKTNAQTISDIQNGRPILYRVRFSQMLNPTVTDIYHNGKLVCSEPENPGYFGMVVKMSARTSFTARGMTYQPQSQASQPTMPRPVRPAFQPTSRPSTPSSSSSNSEYTNDPECGISETFGLENRIIFGEEAEPGQFPWLAVLFYKGQFSCGGTLISKNLVITAAHCLEDKGVLFLARHANFILGKHDLKSDDPNAVISGVSRFIKHPDWIGRNQNSDGDIGIAVLSSPVKYSAVVKPACMWNPTSNPNDLVGQSTYVAGRGQTETGSTSPIPKWTQMTVVDTATCARSHPLLRSLVSERTFCTSTGDGSGTCYGDSGGGVVVFVENQNKWYLRGIVSGGVPILEEETCNTRYPSIFTDVAKFASWIKPYLRTYG